jgi:hypothetical protein
MHFIYHRLRRRRLCVSNVFSQTAEAVAVRIHCETDSPAPLRKCRQNNSKMTWPSSIQHLTKSDYGNSTDSERSCHQMTTVALATIRSAGDCHWSGSAMHSVQQNWLQSPSRSLHSKACSSKTFFCHANQSKGTNHRIH